MPNLIQYPNHCRFVHAMPNWCSCYHCLCIWRNRQGYRNCLAHRMDCCILDGSMCLMFDYSFHPNQRWVDRTLFAVGADCFCLEKVKLHFQFFFSCLLIFSQLFCFFYFIVSICLTVQNKIKQNRKKWCIVRWNMFTSHWSIVKSGRRDWMLFTVFCSKCAIRKMIPKCILVRFIWIPEYRDSLKQRTSSSRSDQTRVSLS